jgi:hypothetical protein
MSERSDDLGPTGRFLLVAEVGGFENIPPDQAAKEVGFRV